MSLDRQLLHDMSVRMEDENPSMRGPIPASQFGERLRQLLASRHLTAIGPQSASKQRLYTTLQAKAQTMRVE